MKIDAHQHFWRYQPAEYPWMHSDSGIDMSVLRRDWLPGDLKPLLDANGIDACIAVQARAGEHETDYLCELAEANDFIAGVVGWTDLCSTMLSARLDAWSAQRKLVGFRHQLQDESNVREWVDQDAFRRGVALLQDRGRVYEVLVYAPQLRAVHEFCSAANRHWLVLDHLGKPNIRDDDYSSWQHEFIRLASLPHVACKLSGLVTEAMNTSGTYRPDSLLRYLDTAVEAFGVERVMFGSDWPVCLLAAPYDEVVGIVERWSESLSPSERAALFGNNATRIYGLQAQ
jgi:L-fuconolactonase